MGNVQSNLDLVNNNVTILNVGTKANAKIYWFKYNSKMVRCAVTLNTVFCAMLESRI